MLGIMTNDNYTMTMWSLFVNYKWNKNYIIDLVYLNTFTESVISNPVNYFIDIKENNAIYYLHGGYL